MATSVDRATPRVVLAAALIAGWMMLLFTGHAFGGAVHGLFLGALLAFPWRAALR